jgi:hypothetical protein
VPVDGHSIHALVDYLAELANTPTCLAVKANTLPYSFVVAVVAKIDLISSILLATAWIRIRHSTEAAGPLNGYNYVEFFH